MIAPQPGVVNRAYSDRLLLPVLAAGAALVHPVELRLGGHGFALHGGTAGTCLVVDGVPYLPEGFHTEATPAMTVHPDGGPDEETPARWEWTFRRKRFYLWAELW